MRDSNAERQVSGAAKSGSEAEQTLFAVVCKPLSSWVCPTTLARTRLCSLCRGLLCEDDALREPLLNVLARYLAGRNGQKHGHDFLIRCTQFCPIQFQKDFCHCRGNAFVPIQECMGLCQMIGIRRSTGGERCLFVICPVFHSYQRGFQCSGMTHTMPPPKFSMARTWIASTSCVRRNSRATSSILAPAPVRYRHSDAAPTLVWLLPPAADHERTRRVVAA